MAVMMGTGSANEMKGSAGNDVMYGEGGKDVLAGNEGDDRIHGGGGNDTIDGADGNDILFGAANAGGTVDMNKFTIAEDITARITFQGESAGYKNTLGMYKIGKDGTIYDVEILFANASLKGSAGNLIAGKSAVDIDLAAGERIGFFVVPDAYSQSKMSKLLDDANGSFKLVGADGKPANVDATGEMKLVHTADNGVETLIKSAYGNSLFASNDAKNGDGLEHTVAAVDTTVRPGQDRLRRPLEGRRQGLRRQRLHDRHRPDQRCAPAARVHEACRDDRRRRHVGRRWHRQDVRHERQRPHGWRRRRRQDVGQLRRRRPPRRQRRRPAVRRQGQRPAARRRSAMTASAATPATTASSPIGATTPTSAAPASIRSTLPTPLEQCRSISTPRRWSASARTR